MTRPVAAFFRSLVVDPRSQRAIDETRLDACFEAAAARSPLHRAICHLRSIVALVRALVGSLPREIGAMPIGPIAWRLTLLTFLPALAITSWGLRWEWTIQRAPSGWWVAELVLAQLPSALLLCAILGGFYAVAWRSPRPLPGLTTVASAFVLYLLLVSVVLPLGSNHYSDLIWETFNLERGTTIANPYRRQSKLLWGLFDGSWPRIDWAIRDLTAAFMCAVWILLATRVRQLTRPKYGRWLAAPIVAGPLFLAIVWLPQAMNRLWPNLPEWVTVAAAPIWLTRQHQFLHVFVYSWVLIGAVVAASVWLTHQIDAAESSPPARGAQEAGA